LPFILVKGANMNRLVRPLVLACLFVAACATLGVSARAADPDKEDEAGKKRAALWQALEKALPKEYQRIEVYAENPSLTAVLFRSKDVTLQFSLKAASVEEVKHMKALPQINRITFEEGDSGGQWVLWYNGRRELTIGAEK
jgi:hypothetical protein